MAGLPAIFAEFEREILRERTRAGLAHARKKGKRLGRPATAAVHAAESGNCTAQASARREIACRLYIGRTSASRIFGQGYFKEIGIHSAYTDRKDVAHATSRRRGVW